jgi:drug/metabolite transporter (DMT)-like permease
MVPSKWREGVFPVLSLLLAAAMWGLLWYPLRLLETNGMPGLWSTWLMYLAATIVGLLLCIPLWREFFRQPLLLVLIAVANGWANVAFILAVIDGTVVRVLLLFYLSPLWTVLLGMLLLKERLTRLSFMVLVVAMTGALFMLWNPASGMPWPRDQWDWLAISAGVAFAFSCVFIRMCQEHTVRVKTTVTWLGVLLTSTVLILFADMPAPKVSTEVYMWALLLGISGTVIMTLAVQYGVTHMPVQRSAVILLFELVAGTVSSLLLTDEVILPREWIGGGMILLAAYVSARAQYLQEARS